MSTKSIVSALAAAGLFMTAALVTFAQQKDTPQRPVSRYAAKASNDPTPLTNAVAADYRIGVSDVINVSVWKDADLSRSVPVRPDGRISLPLIGDLDAAGKTTGELRDLVVARLKPYVPDPDVTIIVEQINSQKYFVIGSVAKPGSYPLTAPVTVVEALAAAGGFAGWAKTSDIMVIRHKGTQTERIRFNYKKWLKKNAKNSGSIEIQNGDVIVVR
ncbi:MAG TPA: polysaccharide biosynthesis/export family protein [Terriglobales bacterium]|nr:polysaccharide biosynthesis/export family protein [Terriglobales bacterium]